MLQRGRGTSDIKYKKEVLAKYPNAYFFKIPGIGGAIMSDKTKESTRLSECYFAAWKAWEDAYYKINNAK